MPYVQKAADGKVVAVSQVSVVGNGWLEVNGNDADYLIFLETSLARHNPFRESDIQLARALEDLITLLIERDLIRFTDFPEAAQKRLLERQGMRARSNKISIIDDESLQLKF